MDTYGIDSKHHIIAVNEGNCTALAAGYHLVTKKIPVVYIQDKVYAIPVIFIVDWREEPGIHDVPAYFMVK